MSAIAVSAATPAVAWGPTRKWWTATILGLGGLLVTWSANGWNWTNTLSGAAITLLTQRLVAYLVPNADTAGGVPSAGKPAT